MDDYHILSFGAHYDIAKIVYKNYKGKYKLLNNGKWYKFDNGKWREIMNKTLRNELGEDILNLFIQKILHFNNLADIETNEGQKEIYLKRCKILQEIALKLKKTSFKESVIKECKCLFIDEYL